MAWSIGAGLDGKGIIVTGAAGGIGRACAEALASAGARVMAVDQEQARLDDVVAGLEGSGHLAAATDLRRFDGHAALVERAREAFGNLYGVVHAAAVIRRRPSLDEITEDDWDLQIDVNLKASFFLCRAAANAMKAAGQGGRIIAFTSQAWWNGSATGGTVYAASKGGLVALLRSLARVYAADGITVNTIAPGLVNTPMLTTGTPPAVLQTMTEATLIGRAAEPEEMAGTVVFLASRHAGYITGATINTTGGLLMY